MVGKRIISQGKIFAENIYVIFQGITIIYLPKNIIFTIITDNINPKCS